MGALSSIEHARPVQMNTRIAEDLKQRGDAVLSRLGYSPSAAVRGLWRFIVLNDDQPERIKEVLDAGTEGVASKKDVLPEDPMAAISELYQETLRMLDLDDTVDADAPSYKELRDAWYEERYFKGM